MFRPILLSLVLAFLVRVPVQAWDDYVKAMPTAVESVPDKVKRLPAQALGTISLPKASDTCVLQITKAETVQASETAKPWIKVYADGRIKCTSPVPAITSIGSGSLSPDEVKWLLHLVINECSGLDRSTKEIATAYDVHRNKRSAIPDDQSFYYSVTAGDRANKFSIPERAIVVRPVRGKLKLHAFASLHCYASYLVARTYLGTSKQREHILETLNISLKNEHPAQPPFEMYHLGAALRGMHGLDLFATFIQEIPIGEDTYQKVSANVVRKTPDVDLETTFNLMQFKKLR